MKNFYLTAIFILFSGVTIAQQFSEKAYSDFRESVFGISEGQLQSLYPMPRESYFKGFSETPDLKGVDYLDSVLLKLELTDDEIALLRQNHFFVTERLSYQSFGQAFHTVYRHDLPVFVSTDAILQALHASYDQILETMEREIMSGNLEEFLADVYQNYSTLLAKYDNNAVLQNGLADADVFVTIAYSLIKDELQPANFADPETVQGVWEAIQNEKLISIPLFTFPGRNRNLDFSQFTVRGHYVYTQQQEWQRMKSLEPYFRAMMWLGRTDFLLTAPPKNPWEEPWDDNEIQRMHIGAFMVNELLQNSAKLDLLRFNEQVINYLVGKSDNITPEKYQSVLSAAGINSAVQITDSATFQSVKNTLGHDSELAQQILSDFFFMDPAADAPGVLPISFRISGQRFIIDSYVLGSVVFDRLMFEGHKVKRMMPKPLDALFTLGNNDVLPLLKQEFEEFPYAEQLANLRYLVDNKPDAFWSGSLYNVWLNSIRELNPAEETDFPVFMQTAAWHQEKINTQLASWSQLRHDNLLYAKQSYTGGTGCSYPFSYIEPYPEFYARLKQFATDAGEFFAQLPTSNYHLYKISEFFPKFANTMGKLETLASKQLGGTPFSQEENEWLKSMLFVEGGSGMPPYSGWYSSLFFDEWGTSESDFTIVDVHTQPTDEFGHMVGKVLHTAVGEVNLGMFLAPSPAEPHRLMAFAGPVMSYYEKITDNFNRLTDQDWEAIVGGNEIPDRPLWTNIYLAGKKGEIRKNGPELPSKLYTGTAEITVAKNEISAYPNPVDNWLTISLVASEPQEVQVSIYNSTGVLLQQSGKKQLMAGKNVVQFSFEGLPEGFYLAKVELKNGNSEVLKIIKK